MKGETSLRNKSKTSCLCTYVTYEDTMTWMTNFQIIIQMQKAANIEQAKHRYSLA